jgi:hypothetical protein
MLSDGLFYVLQYIVVIASEIYAVTVIISAVSNMNIGFVLS